MNLPSRFASFYVLQKRMVAGQFKSGSFLRHFAVLGSGTALAQIIPLLASPILTRLYTPQDFAMFAVFMALVGIFTPVVCGKYEVALVLPANKVHAEHLLGISLYFSFGISAVLAILFSVSGESLLFFLNADKLGGWIFSVPMALLLTGIFTALNYFSNRNKNYSLMSKARVTRALATTTISITFGFLGAHFGGLLAGFFAGLSCASCYLLLHYRKQVSLRLVRWNRAKRWLLKKYNHYPLYNATSGLLDGLTLSLPIFFMSRYFPESVVGYYSLVIRVALTPVSFISTSVSQLNLKKVVDLINSGRSPIPYLLKLTTLLALIIAIPGFIIMWRGPELFRLVFGPQWLAAGEYARILMPAIAVQFIASTLSSTLGATHNNRIGALWKLVSFILTASMLAWFSPQGDLKVLLYAVAGTNIVLYFLYYAAILYAAHTPRNFL